MEGQWVTPREFDQLNRRMDGFEKTQSDMARDVKSLLAAHNLDEGRALGAAIASTSQRDKGARRVALTSVVASLGAVLANILNNSHHHL